MNSNYNILNSHITKEFDLKNYILLLLNGFIKNDFINKIKSYHKINLKIDYESINFALKKDEKISLYLKGILISYNFFKQKHLLNKFLFTGQLHLRGLRLQYPSISGLSAPGGTDSSCSIVKYSVSL